MFIIKIIIFMLGISVGSFINVLCLRGIKRENFVSGRSYCPYCKNTLTSKELVPIFSYLFQKGKCRNCKAPISIQYPLVELITGISFLIGFLTLGFSFRLIIAFILFSLLIEVAIVDIKIGEIPYHCSIIIFGLGIIAFIISFFATENVFWYEHLIGLFIISVPFAVLSFFGAMGGGDVQLMAAAGFLLGWNIVPAAFIAFIIGALAGIIIKYITKSKEIKFGPFLTIGIFIGYLWGNEIIELYLGSLINN